MDFYIGGNEGVFSQQIALSSYNSLTNKITLPLGFPAVPYRLIHDPLIHRILVGAAGFEANTIYYGRETDSDKFTLHPSREDAESNTNKIAFTSVTLALYSFQIRFLDHDIPDNFVAFYAQSTLPKIVYTPDPELTSGYNQIYTSARIQITDAYLVNSGSKSNQGIVYTPSYGGGVAPNASNISIGNIDEVCSYNEGSFYSGVLDFAGVSGRIHFYAQNHQQYFSQYQSRINSIDRISGLGGSITFIPFSLCYSIKKGIKNANSYSDNDANYWYRTNIFYLVAWGYNTTITYSEPP